jgi:phosphatidate cytidylyltransferase
MPQLSKWSGHPLIITGLIAIFCTFSLAGDLLESLIKRESKVKDSGTIMPGHGGLFDRLDGVLVASVFSYFVLIF